MDNSFLFDDEEDTSQKYFVFTISHLLVAFYTFSIGLSLGFFHVSAGIFAPFLFNKPSTHSSTKYN